MLPLIVHKPEKGLGSFEFTALFAHYWLVLGSRTPGCLSPRLVKEPGELLSGRRAAEVHLLLLSDPDHFAPHLRG